MDPASCGAGVAICVAAPKFAAVIGANEPRKSYDFALPIWFAPSVSSPGAVQLSVITKPSLAVFARLVTAPGALVSCTKGPPPVPLWFAQNGIDVVSRRYSFAS